MSPKDGGYFFGNAHVAFVMQYHETYPPYVPDNFTTMGVSIFPGGAMTAVVDPSETPVVTPGVAVFTGAIYENTLTVSEIASGQLAPGQVIADTIGEIIVGTRIVECGSAAGGTGTYIVSTPQVVATEAMTANQPATMDTAPGVVPSVATFMASIAGNTLTVTAMTSAPCLCSTSFPTRADWSSRGRSSPRSDLVRRAVSAPTPSIFRRAFRPRR